MGRKLHKLTAVMVASAKRPGLHGDGGGLHLKITPGKTKSWVFRFTIRGKTRYAGLGSVTNISLAEARERAQRCRKLLADGIDPIEARRSDERVALLAASRAITFKTFAEPTSTDNRRAGATPSTQANGARR